MQKRLPEAAAIHVLNLTGSEFYGDVIKDSEQILADAVFVNEIGKHEIRRTEIEELIDIIRPIFSMEKNI